MKINCLICFSYHMSWNIDLIISLIYYQVDFKHSSIITGFIITSNEAMMKE